MQTRLPGGSRVYEKQKTFKSLIKCSGFLLKFPYLHYSSFSQIARMSNCPYLYGKLWAKICKNNNSISKVFSLKIEFSALIYLTITFVMWGFAPSYQ